MPKNYLNFEQGDIVVATIVFAEQTGAKKRPALVISNAGHNSSSDDVVLLKITSKAYKSKNLVGLLPQDLSEGLLRVESFVAVDIPVSVYNGIIVA